MADGGGVFGGSGGGAGGARSAGSAAAAAAVAAALEAAAAAEKRDIREKKRKNKLKLRGKTVGDGRGECRTIAGMCLLKFCWRRMNVMDRPGGAVLEIVRMAVTGNARFAV